MECTHCKRWHWNGLLSCPTAPKQLPKHAGTEDQNSE